MILTLALPAAFAAATMTPAVAAPGDPVPACVSVTVSNTTTSTRVVARNNCAGPQNVRLILNGGSPVTSCAQILPAGTRTWNFTPRATSVNAVQC